MPKLPGRMSGWVPLLLPYYLISASLYWGSIWVRLVSPLPMAQRVPWLLSSLGFFIPPRFCSWAQNLPKFMLGSTAKKLFRLSMRCESLRRLGNQSGHAMGKVRQGDCSIVLCEHRITHSDRKYGEESVPA